MTYKEYEFKSDFKSDLDIHDNYIKDFDSYEAMLVGKVYDSVSKKTNNSSITDSYSTTLAIERAARVVGKLPDGNTEAAGKKDAGKAMFMDILRQKWIYPNANSQRSFFEKIRLWQLYSSVYGYMPMFYDWNVTAGGYVGPDCWLWSPRNFIPQQGVASIEDMEYATAISWVSAKTIEGWLGEDGWNKEELARILEIAKNEEGGMDTKRDTLINQDRLPGNIKRGIPIATRYEAGPEGKWITFAPDHGCLVLREIPNPHKNGRIPFVVKYSQAMFDSFYGIGDFQRARPLQFARDGLTNFYFQGVKMNLLPPLVANANGVQKHTLDYRPGGIMLETQPNSIRRLETSTAGLATYQAVQSQLTGSLLSLYGTQNASIPGAESLNPAQGKTPAAIKMFSEQEATRDGIERKYMEEALEKLQDGFNSLVANVNTEPIKVTLFSKDIEEIVSAGYEEVLELVTPNASGDAADLIINQKDLKGVEFRFNIEPNSTAQINKERQLEEMKNIMDSLAGLQNVIQDDPRVVVEWGEILKTYTKLSSIPNVGGFITLKSEEQIQAEQQEQLALQQQQMAMEQEMTQSPIAPMNIRGMDFNDPEIGAAAQSLDEI